MTWANFSGSADRLAVRHPRTQTETSNAGEYTYGRKNYVPCLEEPPENLKVHWEVVESVVYAVSLAAVNSRSVNP